PPQSAAAAVRRYAQAGLAVVGNGFAEDPIPGSLFRHEFISYTVASLFLCKPPVADVQVPRCEPTGSVLGDLLIQELPYRVFRGAMALNEMRWKAASLDETRIQLERTTTTLEEQKQLIQSLLHRPSVLL
ncbi:MAG: hypothetical protein WAJ87_10455, partial [Bryobacteraceae bacterium]